MTLQDKISNSKSLWTSTLDVPPPPDATFRLWLVENEYDTFEAALAYAPQRVGRLRRNGRYTPDQVYKFVSMFLHQRKNQATSQEKANLLKPESRGMDFNDAIALVSFKNPQNVARGYVAFVMSEMVRSGLSLSQVRDSVLQDIKLVNEQSVLDAPNLALCSNLVSRIVDSLETATGNADGSALKRLKAFEAQVQKSTGGVHAEC